jgi:hypothetical protein
MTRACDSIEKHQILAFKPLEIECHYRARHGDTTNLNILGTVHNGPVPPLLTHLPLLAIHIIGRCVVYAFHPPLLTSAADCFRSVEHARSPTLTHERTDYIFILTDRPAVVAGLLALPPVKDLVPGLPQKGISGSDHISLCAEMILSLKSGTAEDANSQT